MILYKWIYVWMAAVVLLCATVAVGRTNSDKFSALTQKRITSELKEICLQGLSMDVPFNNTQDECGVRLGPIKTNLFEWHFSFTGMEGSAYEGGVYHGRIRLHPEYPRKAPMISLATPSGRWEVNKEICLSASGYHQETWNPNWNLRTLVLSLRGYMLSQPREIGAISTRKDQQAAFAKVSRSWYCKQCGVRHDKLLGGEHISMSTNLIDANNLEEFLKKKQKNNDQMVSRQSKQRAWSTSQLYSQVSKRKSVMAFLLYSVSFLLLLMIRLHSRFVGGSITTQMFGF